MLDDIFFDQCIAYTICYRLKISQGIFPRQSKTIFHNSVVYDRAVTNGISHQYDSATAIKTIFENIDIECLSNITRTRIFWKQSCSSKYSIDVSKNSINGDTILVISLGIVGVTEDNIYNFRLENLSENDKKALFIIEAMAMREFIIIMRHETSRQAPE